MKKILLGAILLFGLSVYGQEDCNTPCGYCNCEELEGEATINKPAYTMLASGLACVFGFFVLKKK